MARAAYDGGEDGAGSVISGESGLAHTGSVVNDQSGNIIVTHVDEFEISLDEVMGKNCKRTKQKRAKQIIVTYRNRALKS